MDNTTKELTPQEKAKRLQMLKNAWNQRIASTKAMFAPMEDVNEITFSDEIDYHSCKYPMALVGG